MKCQNCGFELPDGVKFCKKCGTLQAPVQTAQAPAATPGAYAARQPAPAAPHEIQAKKRSLMPLIIGLSVVALALIVAIVIVVVKRGSSSANSPSSSESAYFPSQSEASQSRPAPDTEPIVSTASEPIESTATEPTTESVADTTIEPVEDTTAEPIVDPTTDPTPAALGAGAVVYHDMTCSYRQTGEGTVELEFVNNGPYTIEFWWQSTSDPGFTVVATDEQGNKGTEIVDKWDSVANFNAYGGADKAKRTSKTFNGLSGKITEIEILGAAYRNTEDNHDFSHGETILIHDGDVAAPTTEPTSPGTDPTPGVPGQGSVDYHGMTCSYRQTGEGTVTLEFVNNGPYTIEFWWQSTGDPGFTVVAFDEYGSFESNIVKEWGSVAKFEHNDGEADAIITTVPFNGLSGKITEIKILGAGYKNTEDKFDFGHGETITIPAE